VSRIVFRTDASPAIGTGHLARCLVLAEALRDRGAEVCFVSADEKGLTEKILAPKNLPLLKLPAAGHQAEDAENTSARLRDAGLQPDWLVVDHYRLGLKWEKSLRPLAGRIMVIEDLCDREHDCDLLLDQNLREDGATETARHRLPADCRVRSGPRYALLDKSFAEWRRKKEAREKQETRQDLSPENEGRTRLLISLGGSDPAGETFRVLEGVAPLTENIAVTVVAGAGNPRSRELAKRAAELGLDFRHNIDNMAELLAQSDFAVGAGGISNWERCALGVPAIVVSLADNQESPTAALARAGAAIYLGRAGSFAPANYGAALTLLQASPWLRKSLADRARALVDGRGAERIAEILCPLPISLRRAGKEDRDRLLAWRNHEENRRFSFSTATIDPETHNNWFAHTLAYPGRVLLIGELASRPVGVLRYDLNQNEALVSIYMVPGEHGHGHGAPLLEAGTRWLRKHHPEVGRIKAEILSANLPARKVFAEAGFNEQFATFYRDLGPAEKTPANKD
jgi:UDP-2,4-diacetamido-2,4,6-trideoxy-beta-L-altropyranose hydrolase